MFEASSDKQVQRVARVHQMVEALNGQAETWFDGTPDSVDSRVRSVQRVRSASAQFEDTHAITAALDNELSMLADFKDDVLGNDQLGTAAPRVASTAPLSDFGREFVATHVNAFVADNQDAVTAAEELDIRAKNYVDAHVAGRPVSEAVPIVEAFRDAVAAHVVAPTVVERTASVDFDDSLIFG